MNDRQGEISQAGGCACDEEPFEVNVTGYSMLPLLGRGHDRVVVRPCRPGEFKVGRIVLFHLGNRWIVHRIRHRNGEKFVMAGDGNYRKTECCSADDIIGIVDSVIRSNGRRVDCTSLRWRMAERLWLALPALCRRYITAVMRRILDRKRQNKR